MQNVVKQAFTETSASGTELTINNTIEARMEMKLNGNTSQNGEPTPATPQDIEVVTGNNKIIVCGKNLLNSSSFKNITNHGITFSYDNNTGIYTLDGSSDLNNNTFSISKIYKINNNLKLCMYYISGSITGDGTVRSWDNTKIASSITFSDLSTQNPKIVKSAVYKSSNIGINIRCESNLVANNFKFKLMITDSDDTEWEPYQGSTYPISLGNIELCKIGDYQDYLYKNNDKWYKHKETNHILLDGVNVYFANRGDTTNSGHYRFALSNVENKFALLGENLDTKAKIFSNKLLSGTREDTYGITNENVFAPPIKYNLSAYGNIGVVYISAISQMTLDNANAWLKDNNIDLYYVLATPIEEEITDTTLISQLNELSQALSKKGTTIISQRNDDLPFNLDVIALTK